MAFPSELLYLFDLHTYDLRGELELLSSEQAILESEHSVKKLIELNRAQSIGKDYGYSSEGRTSGSLSMIVGKHPSKVLELGIGRDAETFIELLFAARENGFTAQGVEVDSEFAKKFQGKVLVRDILVPDEKLANAIFGADLIRDSNLSLRYFLSTDFFESRLRDYFFIMQNCMSPGSELITTRNGQGWMHHYAEQGFLYRKEQQNLVLKEIVFGAKIFNNQYIYLGAGELEEKDILGFLRLIMHGIGYNGARCFSTYGRSKEKILSDLHDKLSDETDAKFFGEMISVPIEYVKSHLT
jgi:hypothetical protein